MTVKRRDLLQAAVAAPLVARGLTRGMSAASSVAGKNIIVFMTDQERAIQHFPPGWATRHLPGFERLKRHGLVFSNAFCSTCMCSPSRSTFLSGYFPAQHGVVDTLTFGNSFSSGEALLPLALPNIATVLAAAGYTVSYKGKWHVSKPVADPTDDTAWQPSDAGIYGFGRWNPPDAGENQDIDQFGGGRANNDHRFMTEDGDPATGHEGVLAFLRNVASQQQRQPFCLIVSLVNPHDVLAYPRTWKLGGYTSDSWIEGGIDLPATWNEDLSTKPTAQRNLIPVLNNGLGRLRTRQQRLNYLNFYGNLMKQADAYLARMLAVLGETNLLDETLIIRTADHGEVGLAHGGMRQKAFNFYEETMTIPLVFSNPRLFPQTRRSETLVSHVDLLPTLASLVEAPESALANWQGVDYSSVILNRNATAPQDEVVFTYDDIRCGQDTTALVPPPNRVVAVRERRYKLAKYYDGDNVAEDEWEMYDLLRDRLELQNIASPTYTPTSEEAAELARLKAKLADIKATRLQPL